TGTAAAPATVSSSAFKLGIAPQIAIIAEETSQNRVVFYLAGSGTATINWGNGLPNQTITLTSIPTHLYPAYAVPRRRISIYGQDITMLSISGTLLSLDVSKNAALKNLGCYSDQPLTGLDVSNNTALTELRIRYNQFTTAGLNTLFGTLHSNYVASEKIIHIVDNPGTNGCTKSIATSRGGTVNATIYD
ncbi:MAG: hypothetical protein LBV26_04685, partial [Bacteroidales bacterium]|nr:hypothetical protein [Bacteroidales bacterium]